MPITSTDSVIQSVTTLGQYANPFWRKAITQLKFRYSTELSLVFGELLAGTWIASEDDVQESQLSVIPIPLHKRRMRERGFNQSENIARAFVQHIADATIETTVLTRHRNTASQTTAKNTAERFTNIADAFDIQHIELLTNAKRILLVDDVVTTGATTLCAAEALHNAIDVPIHVIAVARGTDTE